jgi:hypothetical protein
MFQFAGLADRPDLLALGDAHARRDGDRAEMERRDRVAVGRLDRDRSPVARQGACEAHRTRCGRQRRLARDPGDVDTPVLTGVVLVRPEGERP